MNWIHLIKSVASGIMAAAEKFEGTAGGKVVAGDVSKIVGDAKSAAIGYVKQGLTQPATDALTKGFTEIGVPSFLAADLAGAAVAQGEALLPSV